MGTVLMVIIGVMSLLSVFHTLGCLDYFLMFVFALPVMLFCIGFCGGIIKWVCRR